jgi:hypothetical protein
MMDPLYERQKSWERVVIRPDDLRTFQRRLSMSVDRALPNQQKWELFSWQDRFQAAGPGSVENQILEVQARHRTMISLEMRIARTPADMTLAEVLSAPRQPPVPPPSKGPYSEANEPPISTHLRIGNSLPGLTLEVLTVGRLSVGSMVSAVTPSIDSTVRKAPQRETIGIAALAIGCAIPDVLLAVGALTPAATLPLVLAVGSICYFGAIRAMEWLFPPMELLPDEHSKTRWQKTVRLGASIGGVIAAITGILGFALTVG